MNHLDYDQLEFSSTDQRTQNPNSGKSTSVVQARNLEIIEKAYTRI